MAAVMIGLCRRIHAAWSNTGDPAEARAAADRQSWKICSDRFVACDGRDLEDAPQGWF